MKSPQRMERKGSKRNTRCDSVRNSQWFHRLVLTLNPRPELWQTSIISESQVMWGEKVKKNYGFKLIRVVVSLALLKSSRKEEETINRILKEIFCSQTNPTPLTSKESKKRGRGMEKWKTEKKKTCTQTRKWQCARLELPGEKRRCVWTHTRGCYMRLWRFLGR